MHTQTHTHTHTQTHTHTNTHAYITCTYKEFNAANCSYNLICGNEKMSMRLKGIILIAHLRIITNNNDNFIPGLIVFKLFNLVFEKY